MFGLRNYTVNVYNYILKGLHIDTDINNVRFNLLNKCIYFP